MRFPNRSLRSALVVGLTLACAAQPNAQLVTARDNVAPADDSWFEPRMPSPEQAGVLLDLSALNRTPAGSDGFVGLGDGHFRDGGGQRLRLFGINLGAEACFPTARDAAWLARLFRRLGLNAVRLQGLDIRALDGAAYDHLDHLVAELKSQGIYVVIVLKTFGYASLSSELAKRYPGGRILDRFAAELVNELSERARSFVRHENPYTRTSYGTEPAVLAFELTSEDTIFESWAGDHRGLPEALQSELARALDRARSLRPDADETALLAEVELETARKLVRSLRDEEHVRSLIVNTQASFGGLAGLLREASVSDYVDLHGFWDQPIVAEPGVSPAFSFDNATELAFAEHGTLARLAGYRLSQKPFVVSEYGVSGANDFAVEGLPLLASIAAFQDWDGIFPYAFRDGDQRTEPSPSFGFFDMAGHPAKLAFLPLAALAFRTPLIAAGPSLVELRVGREGGALPTAESALGTLWSKGGIPGSSFVVRRLGVELVPGSAAATSTHALGITPPLTSETRELIWDAESREPSFVVNAPALKMLLGYVTGRRIDLGGVELEVERTSNGFAAIGIVALDGLALVDSRRMLVVAANRAENSEMRLTRDRRALESWGHAPVRAERVRAQLSLPGQGFRARALELDGTPAGDVKVRSASGRSEFEIGSGTPSLWTLIER